jgi:hypothetical protein
MFVLFSGLEKMATLHTFCQMRNFAKAKAARRIEANQDETFVKRFRQVFFTTPLILHTPRRNL